MLREKVERATGVEPATSSLGTNPSKESHRKTEIKRAKFRPRFPPKFLAE